LPIIGKQYASTLAGLVLESNVFAAHDGGDRHQNRITRQPQRRLATIEKRDDMITYRNLIDGGPPVHPRRNGKATRFDDLWSDRSRRPDHSGQYVSAPAQPPSNPSTNGPKNAQSAAEVVGIRLLAVFTVALFVASIIGLTVFSQDGNSTTAIVSGVIGISSALLGFIVAFHNAYRATTP
jgi:hypothetical protein